MQTRVKSGSGSIAYNYNTELNEGGELRTFNESIPMRPLMMRNSGNGIGATRTSINSSSNQHSMQRFE